MQRISLRRTIDRLDCSARPSIRWPRTRTEPACRHHLAFSEDVVAQTIQHTVQVLRQSETAVPERAIELTIETVAIAAMMRIEVLLAPLTW
jgi:hypothetical protein